VETNLYVARGLLAPYGLSVDTAASGFEAVDKVRDGSVYDIILMDHMMPKMDGIEAVKIIRSMEYHHPIVALTANALAGQAQVFLNNGFDGYISKPIDIRQLNAILNKMIRNKQAPEVLEEARKQKANLYTADVKQPSVTAQLAEIFIRDAEKSAAVMEAIYINKCRRVDDVSMMIINAHAMKSALANIGESDLSEEARKLEQAGRDRDTEKIISEVPVFLEGLWKIIKKLRPKEDEDAESVNENTDEIRIFLREKLLIIQAACSRYDKKSAKETLAEIRQKALPRETKNRLNVMAEHLLHSEFEEAATIAEEIFPY
jgi:CheY-like chemotaxis protein